jgi:hypothetical protein
LNAISENLNTLMSRRATINDSGSKDKMLENSGDSLSAVRSNTKIDNIPKPDPNLCRVCAENLNDSESVNSLKCERK